MFYIKDIKYYFISKTAFYTNVIQVILPLKMKISTFVI